MYLNITIDLNKFITALKESKLEKSSKNNSIEFRFY